MVGITYPPFGSSNLANPTASVGPTAVNGIATTAMRSDAAPALDQTAAYTFTGNITNPQGTITTSKPFTISQTWNASGVTFTGVNFNITPTASAIGSRFFAIQNAGVDKVTYAPTGNTNNGLTVLDTIANIPTIRALGSDTASLIALQAGRNATVDPVNLIGVRFLMIDAGTNGKRWDVGNGQRVAGVLTAYNTTDSIVGWAVTPTGLFGIGIVNPSLALTVPSAGAMGWDNGSGAAQAQFVSPSTGVIQHGAANADTNAAIVAQVVRAQGLLAGGTSNQAGKDFTFQGSAGKGTGAGGAFIIQTAPAGSTGTAVNAFATGLTVTAPAASQQPSVVVGNQALATNATDGFLYIAAGAGPPTGTPTGFTGRVPLYYDSTNNQLYVYNSSWLQPKTPAAAATVTWQ